MALVAATPACGTRRSHGDVVAAARGSQSRQVSTGSDGAADGAGTGPAAAGATDQQQVASGDAAATAAATSGGTVTGAGGNATQPGATGAQTGGASAGAKSPIVIGSVGTQTGIVGATIAGGTRALQAWVKYINAKGGVNGHQVRLIVADDGADPARHQAEVQQMAEQDKVIAFVHNSGPLSGQSSVPYITQKRVPVIGSETGGQWFYKSPMFFPQASSGDALVYLAVAATAQQVVPLHKTRLGSLTCTEAQICTDADRAWSGDVARSVGLNPVYHARASLAQPDFTAECLGAKSNNVDVFQVSMDSNSVARIAAACHRQAFFPIFSFGASIAADDMKDNPDLNGTNGPQARIGLNVLPWFLSAKPAIAEFQAALAKYGAGLGPTGASITGWTSAKLFERATQNLGEPATAQGVLDGLWSIKDDNLGGLTLPLTFTKDQNAPIVTCWFKVTADKHKFTSPDDGAIACKK